MIFVGGMGRSGTSVLMECLKNSGYNIGRECLLHGHKYKSEYIPLFTTLNWLFISIFERDKLINKSEWDVLNSMANFTIIEGVEVLKVLKLSFFLPFLKHHDIAKDPKFILMFRDIDEAIASSYRLSGFPVSNYDVIKSYIDSWNNISEGHPTIRIKHEDLINNTEEVKKKLSVFLDRDIDMSIISPKETYEVSGSVH